jgi:hypothetical protein
MVRPAVARDVSQHAGASIGVERERTRGANADERKPGHVAATRRVEVRGGGLRGRRWPHGHESGADCTGGGDVGDDGGDTGRGYLSLAGDDEVIALTRPELAERCPVTTVEHPVRSDGYEQAGGTQRS